MDSPHPLRQSEARLRLTCPRLARRVGAPHERGESGGSDPPFLAAGAAPGRGSWCTRGFTPSPLVSGGRSLHSDPGGKAEMLKTRTQVVLLILARIVAGLRPWLSPRPAQGEVALLGLVRATDPLGLFTPRAPDPPPTLGPSSSPSRPSGYVGARTGPSGHRLPRPCSGPHAPGPPRSPPGDDPTADESS